MQFIGTKEKSLPAEVSYMDVIINFVGMMWLALNFTGFDFLTFACFVSFLSPKFWKKMKSGTTLNNIICLSLHHNFEIKRDLLEREIGHSNWLKKL